MSYENFEMNEATFLSEGAHCKRVWLWKPKRCRISGKWLWLTHAVCAVRLYIGTSNTVIEYRYYRTKDFLMLKLRTGF